ncbi:hypothetical protein GCM10011367_00730 [Marinicauda pacifica]|uniref:EF-hand domain-containing protein n=1 Tax=Marinicauda pacifica TaxID=1133559 RepID=A0A4S2HFM7_9PROT|nr:EF-hand domain-containing protein [Marinicauda pacifica]TGY94900.1 hypothetical protein E5162_00365 [Marinicauda pacifica]GGE30262.1 hypothetical protein GCM10011367_00730 [Marinicauda pacifica]
MKRLTIIATSATLGLAGTAAHADHHMSGDEHGASSDAAAMFESHLQQAFQAIDTDGNGSISQQEWGNWQADDGFYAERFDEFDTDDDDGVDWDEYHGAVTAMYDTSSLDQ